DNSQSSNTTGSFNTTIGQGADVGPFNLTNATAIGHGAIVDASNKVRIGNSAVTVIEGQAPFTSPSDGRFKFNIREDVKGLDFILRLRPITYQFDVKRFDTFLQPEDYSSNANKSNDIIEASYKEASSIRRTGFIAQEVEKAADAISYNFSGIIKPKTKKEHYSLSYESFVVPLVKAVQEQQQMINEQDKKIGLLLQEIDELRKLIIH
ncbi:MAG TPA: tail fiber domain-containing protein, partial [Chitinophagaceae bacterium]|nr:tail fiber domain-containing protein [Chitinophagaceae bacterium]